jgi:pantetheine-phosphate adenylyltransferase
MKVCIGGTFDHLHKGHKLLINKAFEIAGRQGHVFIGITTGEIIDKKRDVKSFEERKKTVEKYLSKEKLTGRYLIKPIYNKYGPSLKEDFDAIIISPETKHTAEEINRIRKQKGEKQLQIIQIPFVLADDTIPISSSRIRDKEIDKDGKTLKRD